MKKVILFSILILLLAPLVFAENITISENSEESKINKAYECLEGKIEDECSSSLEDNIFVLLAIDKCKQDVIGDSKNNECWPASNCKVKPTAQAILALSRAGHSTDKAEDWLIKQNTTATGLEWYLQIESSETATCRITYSGSEYSVNIGEDKKISSGAGSCLSLSSGAWWLRISQTCYGKEFEISCNQGFLTNLLFRKQGSSTIHISDETNVASAEGTTKEQVSSLCFADAGVCNYEASLWAAFALDYLNYDISHYIPYLMTMADDNEEHIPESFLYILTDYSDFRNGLLLKQKEKYWDESGNKFYDTALALYSLQGEEPVEKSNAKEWLLEVQGKDGCWQGSIRDTAFILHSIWQRVTGVSGDEDDCEDAGYYCMSDAACMEAGGSELDYGGCSFPNICCSEEAILDICAEQGGEICSLDENCIGGTAVDAGDVEYGEQCCVGGTCEIVGVGVSGADCGEYGGICRSYECEQGEEQSYSYSCDYGDICCVKETKDNGGSYWWIWLLLILIILLVIAIIFRDRLKVYWHKFKVKKSKPSGPPGLKPIPMVSPAPLKRPVRRIPRRILPPSRRPLVRRPVARKKPSEIDDVLKKLKEIGR